jgi:hypothetical protein
MRLKIAARNLLCGALLWGAPAWAKPNQVHLLITGMT